MDTNTVNILNVVIAAISVTVAIIFGILAIRIAKQQKILAEKQNQLAEQLKPRKQLQVRIVSYTPLVHTEKEVVKDLEVYYKKSPVKKVSALQIEVINIGNQPIKPEDFVFPMEFSVKGWILEASQTKSSDASIEFIKPLQYACAVIKSETVLLNQGDSVTVLFIIAEDDDALAKDNFNVKGRLVDGSVDIIEVIQQPAQIPADQTDRRYLFNSFDRVLMSILVVVFSGFLLNELISILSDLITR